MIVLGLLIAVVVGFGVCVTLAYFVRDVIRSAD